MESIATDALTECGFRATPYSSPEHLDEMFSVYYKEK